jgi:hypothetical protein
LVVRSWIKIDISIPKHLQSAAHQYIDVYDTEATECFIDSWIDNSMASRLSSELLSHCPGMAGKYLAYSKSVMF